jgi:hypothetical protein
MAHEGVFDFHEENIENFIMLNYPHLLPLCKQGKINELILNDPIIRSIDIEKEQAKFTKYFQGIGVLCLSACNDSILMWSHYADKHRGFCIGFKNNLGFSNDRLNKVVYSLSRKNDLFYQGVSRLCLSEAEKQKKLLDDFVFTKFDGWSYEQEWRITGHKSAFVTYPEDSIDRIIFGVSASMETKNKIRELLKNKNVKFFQAKKNRRHFSVDIIEIEAM